MFLANYLGKYSRIGRRSCEPITLQESPYLSNDWVFKCLRHGKILVSIDDLDRFINLPLPNLFFYYKRVTQVIPAPTIVVNFSFTYTTKTLDCIQDNKRVEIEYELDSRED